MVGFWQMLQSCISSYLLNHLMAYQTAEAPGRPIQKKINVFLSKLSHCHAHDFYRKSFTTWSKSVHKKSQKMTTWKRLKISLKVQRYFFDQSRLKNPCLVCNYMFIYWVNFLAYFQCLKVFSDMSEMSRNKDLHQQSNSVQVQAPGPWYVLFPLLAENWQILNIKCFHLSISSIFILFHPHHLLFSCHFLEKYWQNNSFKTSYLSNLHYLQWSNLK